MGSPAQTQMQMVTHVSMEVQMVKRVAMIFGAVTLMLRKSVARKFVLEFAHQSIARDLRHD